MPTSTWGQDLFDFKEWYDKHPEARPIVTDFYNSIFADRRQHLSALREKQESILRELEAVNQEIAALQGQLRERRVKTVREQ